MKESLFLKQNAGRWKEFESLLELKGETDPDTLAELFVQLTDDLSYARTFYPGTTTVAYLNTLTTKAHQAIYKRRKEQGNRLIRFWKVEVPTAVWEARKEILLALSVFVLSMSIGMISSANDDSFVRLILGDRYVNMTLDNIADDDPMGVYKDAHEIDMFLGITINNVRVSFLAFAAGILVSFGSAYILFTNGVMVGAFQYFFHQHDLLLTSILAIYIHGTLELSAIIIAGGAGIVMGNSILFPGTYSRKQSFMRGAKRGLKIIIGLIPIFIAAGFLEGFVTRHSDFSPILSGGIIILSLLFILGYFGVYPYYLHRTKSNEPISTT